MKQTCVVTGLSIGFLLAGSLLASADGFRNPPEGMQAIGKIGGKVVFVDDASAATHNPANMVDLTNNSVIVSATLGYGTREFEPAMGGKAESDDPWAVLPNVFATWRINEEDLAAGLGLTTPYGRSTVFPKDSILRYSVPYHTELFAVNVNPSLAYTINPKVSVAAGVDVLYGNLDLRQIYPWSLATGNPALPDGETKFTADGYGLGYNLAANWNITERQKASVTYRSKTQVDFEGDSKVSGVPTPFGPVTSKSDFETEIEFPAVLAFGYGIQINDRLRVEANAEWIQHSLFKELTLDAGDNTRFLPSNKVVANWDDNWTFGVGGDYVLNENWILRAGYIYLATPIPSETITPSISEEDQSVVSIGLGYASGAHRVDMAYAYGIFNGRNVENNQNPAFNGDYDFESHLVGLSYGYAF